MMQDLVGIVRTEAEMQRALEGIAHGCKERARRVGVAGNREYNPGWHTALDLANLLTVSEAITRAAIERRESRGGHFRDDYPGEGSRGGPGSTSSFGRGRTARCSSRASRFPTMPAELKRVIEEQK